MKKIYAVVTFLVGGAAGAFGASLYLNDKYKKLSDMEIATIRDYYANIYKNSKDSLSLVLKTDTSDSVETNSFDSVKAKIVNKNNKGNTLKPDYSKYYKTTTVPEFTKEPSKQPYIITSDELGMDPKYDVVSLAYYSDGVLADDQDNELSKDDIVQSIGAYTVDENEFHDDMLCIRNPNLMLDYEITYDLRTFADVVGDNPYSTQEE